MSVQHLKTWKIGDVEVTRIVEINAFEDDVAMLLPKAPADLLLSYPWMIPNFALPDGKMLISFQAFAVKIGERRIMVDTCIGKDREREFDVFTHMQSEFMEDLAAAGFTPDRIDTVLCTHLHFDHIGWNTHLVDGKWVPTFPNARYLIGRTEWEHWQELRRTGGYHHMAHLDDAMDPVVEAGLVDLVEPHHRISEEMWLEPTPGHTPGHVSVFISSKGEEAVITGDLMHHPIQLVLPDEEVRFDMDKVAGPRTRREFVARMTDSPTLVIGSHFADPTGGWVVTDGDSLRFTDQRKG